MSVQPHVLDAVESLQQTSGLRPVRSDDVLERLGTPVDSNAKREMSRVLTRVAALAPDALGRRLVFAGRTGKGYTWTVARG